MWHLFYNSTTFYHAFLGFAIGTQLVFATSLTVFCLSLLSSHLLMSGGKYQSIQCTLLLLLSSILGLETEGVFSICDLFSRTSLRGHTIPEHSAMDAVGQEFPLENNHSFHFL